MSAAHPTDITAFLETLPDLRQPQVPIVDEDTARIIANLLNEGFVSARRMAKEMDATFDDINATFTHHSIAYQLFQ